MVRKLLIFDFDGTLYRGDEPFRWYAHCISQFMEAGQASEYLKLVDRHLDGESGVVAGDNWEAVVALAKRWVPEGDRWQEAFLTTRAYMMSDACPLEVPEGLSELLAYAAGKVRLVVASNSPKQAAEPLLDKLRLSPYFDAIVSDAGKPTGLLRLGEKWGSHLGADQIFCVGDNYTNDIAPGLALGWKTAHISPHRYFPGPADFQVQRLEEVIPAIRSWIAG